MADHAHRTVIGWLSMWPRPAILTAPNSNLLYKMEPMNEEEIANLASCDRENINSYLEDYFSSVQTVSSDEECDSDDSDSGDEESESESTGDAPILIDETQVIMQDVDVVDVDIDTEMQKIKDKRCGCKQFEEGQCLNAISDVLIYELRLNMSEKTHPEKDLMILAILSTLGGHTEMTQCTKWKEQKVRQKSRRNYQVNGIPVCRAAFEFTYG